ncbi:transglycosylase SLT domain-containing protein [Vibrio chaetopteri]|uniref:transglycosylase SLT domain-containing protein n=1 Tax=Vibrio chaetopteri TaxID=3016528 RepID=UPI003AB8E548
MKVTRLAYACLLIALSTQASDESTTLYDRYYDDQLTEKEVAFLRFADHYLSDFIHWRDDYLTQFDAYHEQVLKKWGSAEYTHAGIDVSYSEDLNAKTRTDIENDTVIVAARGASKQAAIERLNALGKALNEMLAEDVYSEVKTALASAEPSISDITYDPTSQQADKQLIDEQTNAINRTFIEPDTPNNDSKLAEKLLAEDTRLQGRERKASLDKLHQSLASKQHAPNGYQATMTIKLKPGTLKKRALRYAPMAHKISQDNDISHALVMAIMHTESAFNPKARSPIPAFGLMQVVPTSAGRDVNRLLYNTDAPMSATKLYQPEFNTTAGTTYLKILDTRYLKSIDDPQSRLYCVIAAYNTGSGNVAKAFNTNGSMSIKSAAKIINEMSPDEVYEQLVTRLPYTETRNYLDKVTNRLPLYGGL